jgi:site-specific recombinase XerD
MLTIFRRHIHECEFFGKSRLARGSRNCRLKCPIHVEGSLGGEKIRKALDLTSWEAASNLITQWNASGIIGGPEVPTIAEAIAKFIADAEVRNLRPESLKKIKAVVEQKFFPYIESRGYRHLKQLDVDAVRGFRDELITRHTPNSTRKRFEYVRAFFRFCALSGWLIVNPALAVKMPRSNPVHIETFDPEDIDRLLDAADRFRIAGTLGAGIRPRIRAMILLLRYSGLRISDATVLARSSLKGDVLKLRTIKTNANIWCPLPPRVIEALTNTPNGNPDYFFWNGRSMATSAVKVWEHTFTRVFEMAEIPDDKRFIHNFRHTFATDLLARGVPIEDVALLLGNSVKIVEKHYSHFVRARQERLQERVRTLWMPTA